MESSEDDAGTATNASRRASAREKDVGLAEDVNATSSFQQEPSEARPSCDTPAMSEDNFDGDSVPSPSAQDNTSTEAILDMIDEIVDGPGAPKRLPLASEAVEARLDELEITSAHSSIIQESTKSDHDNNLPLPAAASPADSAKSELLLQTGNDSISESLIPSDASTGILNTDSIDSLPESSSLAECNEPAVSTQPECSGLLNVELETAVSCPPSNIPSSSEEETVQNISNVCECETQERTVKCVTSSDSRDNVTVESAESTSSDSSVSEAKTVLVEPEVRSPLRRRLIRPAPSDRRPDSTVSSTVDSQIVIAPATEQISSETITKDVTSSSDAVPTIHGNVKPEEIRNVSEINFCKAETSVSPPKKIKLIRQKVITGTSNRDTSSNQSAISSDKDECQSTSSNNHSLPLPEPQVSESTSTVSISQSQDSNETSISVSNCVSEMAVKSPEQAACTVEHSQPSIEQCHSPKGKDDEKGDNDNEQIPLVQPSSCLPNSSETTTDVITCNTEQEVTSLPVPVSAKPQPDINVNDLKQGIESNIDHDESEASKDPESDLNQVLPLQVCVTASSTSTSNNAEPDNMYKEVQEDQKKVPPIKLNLSMSSLPETKLETEHEHTSISKNNVTDEEPEVAKQVPKLTIKLKQPDEMKSPIPKLTIKPIRPPAEIDADDKTINVQQVPCVTKINIKPILKPPESINDKSVRSQHTADGDVKLNASEQLPCITKLNIKPIPKPPEKINDIHRKSSSSEISESECSENDETSTSDQASTSDQGPSDVVPKVTIKLGKPGTESEGKFYTEQNVPKLTIKGFQHDEKDTQEPKLKLIISQSEDKQPEKIPKLTIKTVTKSESQPLSPKLTIKPLKHPDSPNKESEIPKLKISTESLSASSDVKDSPHVPKITIKPVTRSTAMCDNAEHIPVVTKLNIKPIMKPTDSGESSEDFDDKVPVVSKLNIKPVIKPKDNDVDSSVDDVPKITKLNIKPIKNPEENSSKEKDCDELNADLDEKSIPVVTKINIKPIIKPQEEDTLKDSENQSSETGNSSDDNGDHIPIVTKLNIKPIIKPDDFEESSKSVSSSEQSIPVITKLNIKPLVKPGESISPSSPKKEHSKTDGHSSSIPVVTKLNIKPVIRPEDAELSKFKDDTGEKSVKNPPLLMKINMKTMNENFHNESLHSEHACNNVNEELAAPKSLKAAKELEGKLEVSSDNKNLKKTCEPVKEVHEPVIDSCAENPKPNCVPESTQKMKEGDERSSVIKKSNLNTTIKEKLSSQLVNVTECDSLVTGSIHNTNKDKEVKVNVVNERPASQEYKHVNYRTTDNMPESNMMQTIGRQKFSSVQNCTLLKKLLENTRDSLDKRLDVSAVVNYTMPTEKNDSICKNIVNSENFIESGNSSTDKINSGIIDISENRSSTPDKVNSNKVSESKEDLVKLHPIQELSHKANENVTKPLEISISDKITNQSSGQDSPRIILKINKTDHGPSAKIITEEVKRPDTQNYVENTQDNLNDKQSPKKYVANSRRKQATDTSLNLSTGKRLRSSRIVENTEKTTPMAKRNVGKRPSTTETSPPQNKEPELSVLQTKRLKLGQLLSNKSLTISPVTKSPPSPTKSTLDMKQGPKTVNHSLLNNENCSKNGNSKLHNILSNLQAKQMQSLPFNNSNCSEKTESVATNMELNASMSSSDVVEIARVENSHPEVQEMIINENSDFRDFGTAPEEVSQDPLEVDSLKCTEEPSVIIDIPKPVELTPQPKKRGRPRKLPVSEGAKPAVTLPVPALEERPQRSLRLMR